MPDKRPENLTTTAVERTGMVDPYAESIRNALAENEKPAETEKEDAGE